MSSRAGRKALFLLSYLSLSVLTFSCMTFRMSQREINDFFAKNNIEGSQHSYKVGFRDVHYVQAGDESKPLILFVHGSPGSLSAFIHFLADTSLRSRALLISADRPGFGYSNFGNAESSLRKQAETLQPILNRYRNNRPILLVGHSLGGPLIARMAIEYPDLVDGLVLVAGSIDPELEPNETWFRAPLASPFLSWMLPRSIRASNQEIYHLKPELEDMLPMWATITCPVTVIHGESDRLVPIGNTEFARKMLVNAPVSFVVKEKMDHFVPWSDPDLIQQAILTMINTPAVTSTSTE